MENKNLNEKRTQKYCTKCGLVFDGDPWRCPDCNAPHTRLRKYEPFVIKGLTQELNKISKEDGEN